MARSLGVHSLTRDLGDWQLANRRATGESRRPAYRALADRITSLIQDGRVPIDVGLPSERDLAAALGVSRTTITAAYAALREDGYLVSRQGSRSVVVLPSSLAGEYDARDLVGRGAMPGSFASARVHARTHAIDLTCAAMEAHEDSMTQAYAAAAPSLVTSLRSSGLSAVGLATLREHIAARYRQRGLPTTADNILVTGGAQHAFSLILGVFLTPGDRVLIEHPTYPNAISAIRRVGGRPVPVPMTPTGWDLDGLRSAARQSAASLAYLIPDFHNPTGMCLDSAGRAQLVSIAAETRMTLVIDETVVDLNLDVDSPEPVALHADSVRHANVLSVGSMSKSFWAGLRVGWIRADPATIARLAADRVDQDQGSPVIDQLVAVELLARYDELMPMRREVTQFRRAALLDAVAEYLPGWVCTPGSGGFSLWFQMPAPVSSALAATAPNTGALLVPGPLFGLDGAFERFMRLPYVLGEEELRQGVRAIASAYESLSVLPTTAQMPVPALVT